MHIVVITKNTPDTEATVTVKPDGGVNWGDKLVVNPWDEYAMTEAVLLKDTHSAQTTLITVGPETHQDALKHGLAIGCEQAIRVWDDALDGHDSLVYVKAVAAAINKLGDVDFVIFGKEFADFGQDQHIYQMARKLGWNMLGSVAKIDALDSVAKTIRVQRLAEQSTQTVTSTLPAVISVVKDINEPKYPSFIGIRKAGKAEIPVWRASDLDLDTGDLEPATEVVRYREVPMRDGAVEIIEGANTVEQAATLVDKLLEEKVL